MSFFLTQKRKSAKKRVVTIKIKTIVNSNREAENVRYAVREALMMINVPCKDMSCEIKLIKKKR